MKKLLLVTVTAATVAIGTMSVPRTAEARCYGCAIGAGVVAGAIIGGAIANHRRYYYHRHYYDPYYDRPVYYDAPPPDAVAYCMRHFKSYDPRTGTYLGYDGYRHPCP